MTAKVTFQTHFVQLTLLSGKFILKNGTTERHFKETAKWLNCISFASVHLPLLLNETTNSNSQYIQQCVVSTCPNLLNAAFNSNMHLYICRVYDWWQSSDFLFIFANNFTILESGVLSKLYYISFSAFTNCWQTSPVKLFYSTDQRHGSGVVIYINIQLYILLFAFLR